MGVGFYRLGGDQTQDPDPLVCVRWKMNQNLLLILIPLTYAGASALYAAHFRRRRDPVGRTATAVLIAGWGIHTLLLSWRTISTGRAPLANTPEVLSTCAWLLVVVYVYLEISTKDRALGALVAPIVTILHGFASFGFGQLDVPLQLLTRGRWFETHVFSNILAYTAFSISWVSSVMYVFLLGEIQTKHLGFFYKRLPSLQTLDQINGRAASFGLVFLSLGLFASSMWAHQALGRPWVWDEPAFAGALIAWFIYAGHLFARLVAGWGGKRAAFFSIVGFTLVLFTFPVVGIFFPGKHSFAN